jgi:hypothetical protein
LRNLTPRHDFHVLGTRQVKGTEERCSVGSGARNHRHHVSEGDDHTLDGVHSAPIVNLMIPAKCRRAGSRQGLANQGTVVGRQDELKNTGTRRASAGSSHRGRNRLTLIPKHRTLQFDSPTLTIESCLFQPKTSLSLGLLKPKCSRSVA